MGSRRRLSKYGKAHHKFLLALEQDEKRKKQAKATRKANKQEEHLLANALSSFNVGGPVSAPHVGAPITSSPTQDDSSDHTMDVESKRSLRGITKKSKDLKKRRERRTKIARRAKERLERKGIAMSTD